MVKFTAEMKSNNFEVMPAGVTILQVEDLKVVQSMGKVKAYKARFKDAKGRRVFNDYKTQYDGAMHSFYAMLTRGCDLSENSEGDIDESQAIGKYLVARICHNYGDNDRVFVNLGFILGHADGFNDDISKYLDEEEKPKPVLVEEDPYA